MATNSKGMSQDRSDYGMKGETGEKIPSRATSTDSTGERKVKVPMQDKMTGNPSESGAKAPAGAKGNDATGERKVNIMGGVGQGMHDRLTGRDGGEAGRTDGHTGELNTGKKESNFYRHKKADYK